MKNLSKKVRYTFDYKDHGRWVRSVNQSCHLKDIIDIVAILGVLERSKYRIVKLTIHTKEEIVK